MRRTQVYLEPELTEALDRLAQQRGTSRAGLLREAAHDLVARAALRPDEDSRPGMLGPTDMTDSRLTDPDFDPDRVTSMLDLIGAGRGGPGNVAEDHDEYLVETELAKWKQQR